MTLIVNFLLLKFELFFFKDYSFQFSLRGVTSSSSVLANEFRISSFCEQNNKPKRAAVHPDYVIGVNFALNMCDAGRKGGWTGKQTARISDATVK